VPPPGTLFALRGVATLCYYVLFLLALITNYMHWDRLLVPPILSWVFGSIFICFFLANGNFF
jgi:hypothetical protein